MKTWVDIKKNKSMADTDQFIQDYKNKMYKMKSDLKFCTINRCLQ